MGTLRLEDTLPRDANGREIQVAQRIQNRDNTGTPLESPISLLTTAVQTLVVPVGALVLVLQPTANFLYGDNTTLDDSAPDAGKGCSRGVADGEYSVPVADLQSVSVRNEATGTNNLHFHFEIMT